MKKHFLIFSTILIFSIISFTQTGCSDDESPTPTTETYNGDIKGIINTHCAYSGCHVAGFASGDFTTYAGMQSRLDNGRIEARTITQMNMPPSSASGPALSTANFDKLKSWLEGGYPEN